MCVLTLLEMYLELKKMIIGIVASYSLILWPISGLSGLISENKFTVVTVVAFAFGEICSFCLTYHSLFEKSHFSGKKVKCKPLFARESLV